MFDRVFRGIARADQADVTEILEKVAETYQAAKEYVLEADMNGREGSSHMRLAFKAPNRYRMEASGLFSDDPAFADVLIVHDGSTVWFYLPKSNEYTSFPASELTNDAPSDLGDLRPEAIDDFTMSRYRDAGDYTGGATLLREETIDIGGVTVDCYVLHVPAHRGPAAYTWWVDKKDSRILREDHAGSSAVFTTIKLDDPVAADLFKFTPPPGAKKVERQPRPAALRGDGPGGWYPTRDPFLVCMNSLIVHCNRLAAGLFCGRIGQVSTDFCTSCGLVELRPDKMAVIITTRISITLVERAIILGTST